jgi:serine O-acetyltransferase
MERNTCARNNITEHSFCVKDEFGTFIRYIVRRPVHDLGLFPSIFYEIIRLGLTMRRDLYTQLVYARRLPLLGRMAYLALKLLGAEIPRSVAVGQDFELAHGGFGVVIHPWTRIGDRVKIYPGVTLGRADIYNPIRASKFKGIRIEDDVILAPGAKVLCKEGLLTVGRGTVVGANAVLLSSTGEGEVWGGVPARCLGLRQVGAGLSLEVGS